MLTQLNRLMALMVLCGLLALMARPAQAQGGFDLDGYYIVNGELGILIKEGHDELVECLRWAANQGKVEIGGCAQITDLTIYGRSIAEWWDSLAATTGLMSIQGAVESQYFHLVFPLFPDRLTAYRLYFLYSSLPYVEYVLFNEIMQTGREEMPSAISETTWGFIKHRGLDLSRKVFHAKD